MLAHLENCSHFKYISVDTEGYTPDLLGISISDPALNAMYFPLGHRENVNIDKEVQDAIYSLLVSVPYRIFHHGAHDLIALKHLVNLFDLPFVDTMIMGHMVDENLMSKGLDFMHKWYCGGEGKLADPLMESIKKTMGWYHIPFVLVNEYASWDARITMELFLTLLPQYEEQFGPLWSEK